jgi:hypothetical protein
MRSFPAPDIFTRRAADRACSRGPLISYRPAVPVLGELINFFLCKSKVKKIIIA